MTSAMQNPAPIASGGHLGRLVALYTLSLRQHLHGKRWMIMALLLVLPPALAMLVRGTAPDLTGGELEFLLVYMLIPQAMLPLTALIYASGIIQDEQEDQTITYLLMRPISKWAIYFIKLLAAVTMTIIITALFCVLTYSAIYIGRDTGGVNIPQRCLQTICIHSLAVIAYCSVFGLMSLITRRVLIVGIVYIAVVEGLMANLPLSIRLLTVIYYARIIAYRTLSFIIVNPHGMTNDIAADAWQLDLDHDPMLLQHPQTGTCVSILLMGSLVCAVIASILCMMREFYVKTPEKS
jgi:ABC-2 type transport system permease protein